MRRKLGLYMVGLFVLSMATLATSRSYAQSTEERFQDLFVTAGYGTAFGAALGAALLSFTPNPAKELRFVAVGASLGFIGGSALGSWIIFSPMMASVNPAPVDNPDGATTDLASVSPVWRKDPGLTLSPVLDSRTHKVQAMVGTWTIATF